VLITDGENNAGAVNPQTAAALLPDLGISFWVIGIGTGGEVPFSYVDHHSGRRREGTLNSRYDAEALKRLAATGGGAWIPAASVEAFSNAFTQLEDAGGPQEWIAGARTQKPMERPFIAAALALLCIVFFVRKILLGELL
jgi:Ca-activated chloride channel family protein